MVSKYWDPTSLLFLTAPGLKGKKYSLNKNKDLLVQLSFQSLFLSSRFFGQVFFLTQENRRCNVVRAFSVSPTRGNLKANILLRTRTGTTAFLITQLLSFVSGFLLCFPLSKGIKENCIAFGRTSFLLNTGTRAASGLPFGLILLTWESKKKLIGFWLSTRARKRRRSCYQEMRESWRKKVKSRSKG